MYVNAGSNARRIRNLELCLSDIKRANGARAAVHAAKDTPFSGTPEQEVKLERLWNLLQPNVTRSGGRISSDWGRIGFQQSDPASDFRSAGELALNQLVYMAETRTSIAQRMVGVKGGAEYPWACVGINVTVEAVRLLDAGLFDVKLYAARDDEHAVTTVHDLYADMFEVLHAAWIETEPENLLQFPSVRAAAFAQMEMTVKKEGGLVPPGNEC